LTTGGARIRVRDQTTKTSSNSGDSKGVGKIVLKWDVEQVLGSRTISSRIRGDGIEEVGRSSRIVGKTDDVNTLLSSCEDSSINVGNRLFNFVNDHQDNTSSRGGGTSRTSEHRSTSGNTNRRVGSS
jgi:hypothetical protein